MPSAVVPDRETSFETVVSLRDGGLIRIRAIRPDDKDRLLAHFLHLSPASVYQRFFGIKKTLTPEELKRFTELDFVDTVGLAATIGEGPAESFIGVGRYIVIADSPPGARHAEVAFAVADEHQGRGIATRLLEQLVPFARKNGITAFEAEVLSDNIHMLHVFVRMGFSARHPMDGNSVQLRLAIDPVAAPPRARPRYGFLDCRVADAMTRNVVTVTPATDLSQIEAIFELHHFNGLPVVEADGSLAGFLTKLDLLRAFAFSPHAIVPHYEEIAHSLAEQVMNRTPAIVHPDLPLTRALELLVATKYKSLPVVANGRLVGILSRQDVLAALRSTAL